MTEQYMQPKYQVILPHTLHELHVRGLSIEEEDVLKSSMTSPKMMYENLTNVIFSCIDDEDKKKAGFKDVRTFMSLITPSDRDALLMGIVIQSYDDIQDLYVTCSSCGKNFTEKSNMVENIDMTPYDNLETPILNLKPQVQIPEYGWTVYLKQPTLLDETNLIGKNKQNTALSNAANYIIVDRIEFNAVNAKNTEVRDACSNTLEIYGMICKKPVKVRKTIMTKWNEIFGKYGIKISHTCTCTSCGNEITNHINPISHVFFLVAQI